MIIQPNFKAAWWLSNPHLQTLYPTLFRRRSVALNIKRERLITPDNDFIDIDWCGEGNKPLVILLHGLTGNSNSSYISGMQHFLLQKGLRSVTLNFRGCSGEPNRLAKGYHSGETGDLNFVYQTILQRQPDTAMAIIGFSLGGNVLLKWLGEQANNISLKAAIAVSVPLVLSECATKLDNGFSKFYRYNLIKDLVKYIKTKQVYLEKIGAGKEADKIKQLGDLSTIKSFWQYDDQVVARLYGFKDVHDYYKQSSSRQYLYKIKIPTLIIQSNDDPFMTKKILPKAEELSSSITLEVTSKGGHVGFISGSNPFKPEYWLEKRILYYLKKNDFC
ncbi:MAG: hydrolase [Pseudomonadota bacterium]